MTANRRRQTATQKQVQRIEQIFLAVVGAEPYLFAHETASGQQCPLQPTSTAHQPPEENQHLQTWAVGLHTPLHAALASSPFIIQI